MRDSTESMMLTDQSTINFSLHPRRQFSMAVTQHLLHSNPHISNSRLNIMDNDWMGELEMLYHFSVSGLYIKGSIDIAYDKSGALLHRRCGEEWVAGLCFVEECDGFWCGWLPRRCELISLCGWFGFDDLVELTSVGGRGMIKDNGGEEVVNHREDDAIYKRGAMHIGVGKVENMSVIFLPCKHMDQNLQDALLRASIRVVVAEHGGVGSDVSSHGAYSGGALYFPDITRRSSLQQKDYERSGSGETERGGKAGTYQSLKRGHS
uniref:Uncharacterized protein n=1 Tax=Salix viminalis TaxID=40686 RepID=A0A6N2LIX7_SALVM